MRTTHITGDELDRVLLNLRAQGVTYRNLAIIAEYFYGWRLPAGTIRHRLRRLGAAPDITRARRGEQNGMIRRRQSA